MNQKNGMEMDIDLRIKIRRRALRGRARGVNQRRPWINQLRGVIAHIVIAVLVHHAVQEVSHVATDHATTQSAGGDDVT